MSLLERIVREKVYINDLIINTGKSNTLPVNDDDIVNKDYIDKQQELLIINLTGTSIDNSIVRFDDTNGKVIKDSFNIIDDNGNLFVNYPSSGTGNGSYIELTDINSQPTNPGIGFGNLYKLSNNDGLFWKYGTNAQRNLAGFNGDLIGPGSSTDKALARFDGITGKLIQDSIANLDDNNNLSGLSNILSSNGYFQLSDLVDDPPTPPLGLGRMYKKNGIPCLWYLNNSGIPFNLTCTGGDVFGPGSSINNQIARFNGTTGKIIQTSNIQSTDLGDILGSFSINNNGNINTIGNHILENGYIEIADIIAPFNPLDGQGRLYKKTGTNSIFWLPNSGGSEINLVETGGDVFGPGSSTNNALARYDLGTGKLIKNSNIILSDLGDMTGIANITNSGNINTMGNFNIQNGYIQISDIIAPSNPANGQGKFYKKTGDDRLFWKPNNAGPEVDITSTGGDLFGSIGSTDNSAVRFDTVTGKLIQNSNMIISDTGAISSLNNITNTSDLITNNANILLPTGYLEIDEIATPVVSGLSRGKLYKKTGDDGIFWYPNGGSEVDLTNTGGDVFGSVSSTNNAIVFYNTGTGKLLKNSSLLVDGLSNINGVNNINMNNYVQLSDISEPANPANGQGRLYKKTGDDGLFWLPDNGGSEVDLTDSGSSSVLTFERIDIDSSTIISNTINSTILEGGTVDFWTSINTSTINALLMAGSDSDINSNPVFVGKFQGTINIVNSDTTAFGSRVGTGGDNGIMIKYNIDGDVQWATRVTAASINDIVYDDCAVQSNTGSVVATGYSDAIQTITFYDADNSTTNNLIGTNNTSNILSGFVVNYNSAGVYQWSSRILGTSGDENQTRSKSCKINNSGTVSAILNMRFFAGGSIRIFNSDGSQVNFTSGSISNTYNLLLQYSSTGFVNTSAGNGFYATVTSTTDPNNSGLSTDIYTNGDCIYCMNFTNNITFRNAANGYTPNSGAVVQTINALNGIALVKFNSNGQIIGDGGTPFAFAVTTFNLEIQSQVSDIMTIDKNDGSVYVAFSTSSTGAIPINDRFNTPAATTSAGSSGFLVKYDSNGNYIWHSRFTRLAGFFTIYELKVNNAGFISLSGQVDLGDPAQEYSFYNSNNTLYHTFVSSSKAVNIEYDSNGFGVRRYYNQANDFTGYAGTLLNNNAMMLGYNTTSNITPFNTDDVSLGTITIINPSLVVSYYNNITALTLDDGLVEGFYKVISYEGDEECSIAVSSILKPNGTTGTTIRLTKGEAIKLLWSNALSRWNVMTNTGTIF